MSQKYTEEFKKVAVQKFLLRGHRSVEAICKEMGVAGPSIYQWVRLYGTSPGMKKTQRRPQDWSAVDKFKAVMEFSVLTEQEQGEYLRKEGLHSEHILSWKKLMEESLGTKKSVGEQTARAELSQLKTENKELKKNVNRKDRALAEATALLILKKKVDLLWGTGEDE